MKLLATVAVLGGAVAFLSSCANPHSPAGFRLPEGDAARGQQAFLDLECNACHRVSGLDLPAPTVEPPVPVVLGGEIPHVRTDGDLVTSIINPSHAIVPGFRESGLERNGQSRMLDYRDRMTVGQLVDLVAFLQSRYRVIRPGRS
jgi:L-cysteine S-thiosulfotransferase